MDLVELLSRGDKAATARAITLVENAAPAANRILKEIYPLHRKARVIGVTGPSGVGKSCLVDRLIEAYRERGKTVGVLAVDPTSPITGGAILGDRIRMQRHSLDQGVFIRSMGSRGSMGGLSEATSAAIDILVASGRNVVIVETVGIGQVEIDVAKYTDTVLIVLVPELGDGVQALKAGLLEIGDIYVVNKADHEGADKMVHTLLESFSFSRSEGWNPTVVETVATSGKGIRELLVMIGKHWDHLDSISRKEKDRLLKARDEILDLLGKEFSAYLSDQVITSSNFKKLVKQVSSRRINPRSAARKLFREIIAE